MMSSIVKIIVLTIKVILGLLFEIFEWIYYLIFFWRRQRIYIYEFGLDDLYPSRLSRKEARKRQIKNRRARNSRQKMRRNRK